ncbi:MAG: glucose-6-phosphate dehydrogenase [Acidobacteriota bacterium]
MNPQNPLRQGMRMESTAPPCAIVIFGASGDLTRRKLLPALYNLAREQRLAPGLAIIGFARREKSDEAFRDEMKQAVEEFSRTPLDAKIWDSFAQGMHYLQGDFQDASCYEKLGQMLDRADAERGTSGNRVYYLATPPEFYDDIALNLGKFKMDDQSEGQGHWKRIVVEKPIGHDLDSARSLNRTISQVFEENQIYRIDHYLGKETVQNILVFRFANGIYEPIWNRQYIDHVQITVAEEVGVGTRAGYYEQAGALRDIVQNHLIQIVSLAAMEPPILFDANSVRDEKSKVMRSIRHFDAAAVDADTVRAQYAAGSVGGEKAPGYLDEQNVAVGSTVETYATVRFWIDNWRWKGVPFYVRSGKRLPKRVSEVAIQFKKPPHGIFRNEGAAAAQSPNVLALRIQPDEGISIRSQVKVPGQRVRIRPVMMDFRYGSSFGVDIAEAYERLLLDCMLGDSTLFIRGDELEASWTLVTEILEGWARQKLTKIPQYEAGSWGPAEADALLERDGRRWRRL